MDISETRDSVLYTCLAILFTSYDWYEYMMHYIPRLLSTNQL